MLDDECGLVGDDGMFFTGDMGNPPEMGVSTLVLALAKLEFALVTAGGAVILRPKPLLSIPSGFRLRPSAAASFGSDFIPSISDRRKSHSPSGSTRSSSCHADAIRASASRLADSAVVAMLDAKASSTTRE